MKTLLQTVAITAGLAFSMSAIAADPLHNTKWLKTKDGKPSAIIKFTESGGVLSAKIDKVVDPRSTGQSVCKSCKGKFKDKKLTGAQVLWSIKPVSGEKYGYIGKGYQPEEGRGYKAKLTVMPNGKLNILGSVGPFSKTQILTPVK